MDTEIIKPKDLVVGDVIIRDTYVGPFPAQHAFVVTSVRKRRTFQTTMYRIDIERDVAGRTEKDFFTLSPGKTLVRQKGGAS